MISSSAYLNSRRRCAQLTWQPSRARGALQAHPLGAAVAFVPALSLGTLWAGRARCSGQTHEATLALKSRPPGLSCERVQSTNKAS